MSAQRIDTDIVIVGGGLVGLTLGRALALKGIGSVVVDREPAEIQTDAAYDGRGSAIALGSKQLLERIGLWCRIEAAAGPILDIRVSDGDSRLFLHYDHREVGDQPMGWIVENIVTRRALFDGLAEVPDLTLLAPCSVTSLKRGREGVIAELTDGRTVAARLAVAADGRGSRLREEAGIKVTRWSYGQTGIVCSVSLERPHRNVAHERFLPAGPFALLPMTGIPGHPHRASIVWTERDDLVPRMMALDDDDFSAEMNRRFGDYCGKLTLLGRRWHYPLSLLLAERMTDRRLALVGDAAHGIHPIAGQGLNLGLRDVETLVEVLAETHGLGLDPGSAALLADYDRRRRVDTMMLVAATDGLNRLFSNDIAPVRLARRLGLATVNQLPPLKRLFMRHAMGTIGG